MKGKEYIQKIFLGIPWQSGGSDSVHGLGSIPVQELSSHKLHGMAKN